MNALACSIDPDSRRLSIGANLGLAIYKLASGLLGGSVSLVAAGAHSFAVAIGSSVNAIGARISSRAVDPTHPYGHGKALLIGSLFAQAFLVLFAMGIVVGSALGILGREVSLPARLVGLAGAMVCAASELHLSDYFHCAGSRSESSEIMANVFENRALALSSLAAVAGIAGALLIHPVIERVSGMVVGVVLASSSLTRAMAAASCLMDRGVDARGKAAIEGIALRHQGVCGVEHVLTRHTGTSYCVDVEILVSPDLSVPQADAIAGAIRADLARSSHYEYITVLVSPSPSEAP